MNHFRIWYGKNYADSGVMVDGKILENVTHVEVTFDVNERPVVVLTVLPESVEVEGEAKVKKDG
jgi:hypothetical protein